MTDPIYKNKLAMMNDGSFSSTNTRVQPYSLCNTGKNIPPKRSEFWKEDMSKKQRDNDIFTQGNTSTICEINKSMQEYNKQQGTRYGNTKNHGKCKY